MRPMDEAALMRAGVRYLQRYCASRAHFVFVMKRKMQRVERELGPRAIPDELALFRVVDACERAGLLDDQAYAKAVVNALQNRGYGVRAVAQRLEQKGVPEHIRREAIANLSADDLGTARAFAKRKRLGIFRDPQMRLAYRQKDLAKLARRGFSFDVCRRALAEEDFEA